MLGFTAAAVVVAAAVPVGAQEKNFGIGFHGGYLQSGQLAENPATGVEMGLDPDAAFGGGLEWWAKWIGLRADFSYVSSPWQLDLDDDVNVDIDGPVVNPLDAELDALELGLNDFGDVNTWFFDVNLMVRLLPVERDRWFAPYVTAGAGFITWDHDTFDTDLNLDDEIDLDPDFDLLLPIADVQVEGDSQSEPAFTFGLGTDIFFTRNVALRIEGRDYWNPNSPYIRLDELIADEDSDRHHDGGNNWLWTAGLQFAFGGGGVEEPGFIAVEPEPPPPPPPAPPATEMVGMCVVGQDGRLQMIQAKRYIETNEIRVLRGSQEVAFQSAYPANSPQYVRSAGWYVSNRPLVVDLSPAPPTRAADSDAAKANIDQIEFVKYGSPQPMPTTDLIFVGTVDATPLYARTADVGGFRADLENWLRAGSDIDRLETDKAFADRYVNEIQTFYMAVEPGPSCVFQPVSSVHTVRRTRG
jgi:opacity protein-like surface antigen